MSDVDPPIAALDLREKALYEAQLDMINAVNAMIVARRILFICLSAVMSAASIDLGFHDERLAAQSVALFAIAVALFTAVACGADSIDP